MMTLRFPWQKQAEGSWKQLKTSGAKEGGEITYYEDKFAQIWNINIPAFDASGCFATCHVGENSDVKDCNIFLHRFNSGGFDGFSRNF